MDKKQAPYGIDPAPVNSLWEATDEPGHLGSLEPSLFVVNVVLSGSEELNKDPGRCVYVCVCVYLYPCVHISMWVKGQPRVPFFRDPPIFETGSLTGTWGSPIKVY